MKSQTAWISFLVRLLNKKKEKKRPPEPAIFEDVKGKLELRNSAKGTMTDRSVNVLASNFLNEAILNRVT